MTNARRLLLTAGIPLAALVALQLVPYGREHTNPPVVREPAWDSPRTRELAQRACFDCHSRETRWPWYASIAPLSWRIQNHVDEGRAALDFSDFRPQDEEVAEAAGEAAETVTKREMPPFDYGLAHAEARLSASEREELARGLAATFAAFAEDRRGGGEERREEGDERRRGRGRRGDD